MRISWFGGAILVACCLACGGLGTSGDTIYMSCQDRATKLLGEAGTQYRINCPSMCTKGTLYGTDLYTDDSSVCKAALHAGVIDSSGGTFMLTIQEGSHGYEGSERNSIKSRDWDKDWARSFSLN